jgi:hypothetical protein
MVIQGATIVLSLAETAPAEAPNPTRISPAISNRETLFARITSP